MGGKVGRAGPGFQWVACGWAFGRALRSGPLNALTMGHENRVAPRADPMGCPPRRVLGGLLDSIPLSECVQ